MYLSYQGIRPKVGEGVYVDPSARVIGDVTLEDGVTVLPNAVIRADEAPIVLRAGSVVEDGCVLHADREADGGSSGTGARGLVIEARATIGHGAIVHGVRIGEGTLVGMGAIVLSGAAVGCGCLVAAGALVTERARIEDGMLAMGVPARAVRPLGPELAGYIRRANEFYQEWGRRALVGALREVEPEPLRRGGAGR